MCSSQKERYTKSISSNRTAGNITKHVHITQNGDICLLTVAKQAENFIYCYLIFSITQII